MSKNNIIKLVDGARRSEKEHANDVWTELYYTPETMQVERHLKNLLLTYGLDTVNDALINLKLKRKARSKNAA